jgi:hypothetical protein
MRHISLTLFWSGLIFGVLNLVLGMAVAFGLLPWRHELPWFDLQDVKCHKDEVYIGLGYFSTVMVYDTMGSHVRSIPVNTHAKPFHFTVEDNGVVSVRHSYTDRSDMPGSRSNGQKGWSLGVGSALMDKRDGELSTGVLKASSFDQALLAG